MFRRKRNAADFSDEIRAHIQLEEERLVEQGVMPEEARKHAHQTFGNVTLAQERFHEFHGWVWLDHLWQDVRYGLRMLRKSPSFTFVAVLTVSLGIGANTAIFSMVDSFLLRPTPVSEPQQIATLDAEQIGGAYSALFSYPDFQDIHSQSSALFSDVATSMDFHPMDGLSIDGNIQPIWTAYVSANFFRTMGVKPVLGNFIEPVPGAPVADDPVLVLSYVYWKAHFAGTPQVVGKSVMINGHPVTIIGVAPKGFHGISSLVDIQGYLPLGMASVVGDSGRDFLTDRKATNWGIYTRLRPGVTLSSVKPELTVIGHRLAAQYPDADKWISLLAYPLVPDSPVDDPSGMIIVQVAGAFFLVLAALVLLLACLNVANLLLARASAREREMALRAAIGARRNRLVRQLLTESLLLALLGCAGGIALGLLGSSWLGSINLNGNLPLVLDFQFDWRVFAYALGAAVLTGVVVGIAPALHATAGNLNDLLHESGRTTGSVSRRRKRNLLVIAQVGGSLMLLIVAGLFVRSMRVVEQSNLGFNPNNVLNFTLDSHEAGYNEAQARNFYQALLPRVRALPGIDTASLAFGVPMDYTLDLAQELNIEGYQPPKNQGAPVVGYNAISPQYFETMGIPLLRGRGILDSDTQAAPHVAVINEAMAGRYWHGQDPIGRRFTTASDAKHPIEVVGIAKNCRCENIRGPINPQLYLAFAQQHHSPVALQVRTSLPLATVNHEIVGLVHSLGAGVPVSNIQTMTDALDTLRGFLLYQIGAGLAAALGFLGLTLAVVGVYGVVSCAAGQRTHEIGIRMALGARPVDVLGMVLRQGFVIVGAGLLVGILAAFAIARLAGNFLSGVSPLDPLTYISASILLAIVALAACYIPARRAMKVDPMIALRYE
ncbi:MAG TPA: ABC transporter permease [Candidatus Acidoferrales bacterium]|nr:ABC transporter permease [Candidatus Acidoferrales bacterium]